MKQKKEQKIEEKNYNKEVERFEKVVKKPILEKTSVYYTGVDLGTACIVLTVLNEKKEIVAGAYKYASVVKDGMVVDYLGAVRIVRELKEEIEKKLNTTLLYAAAAIPPETDGVDGGAVKNVVESAGFELTNLLDEPTAANELLQIKNGAIVDIGGGTTGIAILKDGKVVYVADEATGGTHLSLVISGAYKMTFEEAELYKRDEKNHKEILPSVIPVIEKISSIVKKHIQNYDVDEIFIVGGTCCLEGIEDIMEKSIGKKVIKPKNPMFVTPIGIAKSCKEIK